MLKHYEETREIAQTQGREVLELELGDGWDPLCAFLGEEVPSKPYPRENAGEAWVVKMRQRAWGRTKVAVLKMVQGVVVVGLALAVVLVQYATIRRSENVSF